jgi:predicted restriction endonuclease
MNEDLRRFVEEIALVRRSVRRGRRRPHKLVLLLTILELYEEGHYRDNRIYFDERLIDRFEILFEKYRRGDDLPQAAPPFFHLRSSGFWHHQVVERRIREYRSLSTSGGGSGRIQDNIEYAYLSGYAFRSLSDPCDRVVLRDVIQRLLIDDTDSYP